MFVAGNYVLLIVDTEHWGKSYDYTPHLYKKRIESERELAGFFGRILLNHIHQFDCDYQENYELIRIFYDTDVPEIITVESFTKHIEHMLWHILKNDIEIYCDRFILMPDNQCMIDRMMSGGLPFNVMDFDNIDKNISLKTG